MLAEDSLRGAALNEDLEEICKNFKKRGKSS